MAASGLGLTGSAYREAAVCRRNDPLGGPRASHVQVSYRDLELVLAARVAEVAHPLPRLAGCRPMRRKSRGESGRSCA